jgi:polysaccharide export outer membrane protein
MMTTHHMVTLRLRQAAHHARLMAALLLLSVPALAQFNGPASLGGAEINRPVSITTDQDTLFPPILDTPLVADDLINIRIFGQPDYTPTVRIATDGNVLLPLIGNIHLAGLTVAQAQELIAHRLIEDGMYRDPQVNLQIGDGPNTIVTVMGEIHNVIPLTGKRRLLDILAAAGGIPPTASHVITINRPGVADPIIVDLGNDPLHSNLSDIPIFPGDTIIVSRLGVVYVLGGFKSLGIVPLSTYNNLTLTQLTALSGGVNGSAKFSELRLIRTVGNHRTVTRLDIKKIINGKASDPYLQPNDILYMPNSLPKLIFSTAALGTILGLTSIFITLAYLR